MAMEHDGSIYSCDHYVYPEFKIGNVRDAPLSNMLNSEKQRKFGKKNPIRCLRNVSNTPKHQSATAVVLNTVQQPLKRANQGSTISATDSIASSTTPIHISER
jgi:hypothetical protein